VRACMGVGGCVVCTCSLEDLVISLPLSWLVGRWVRACVGAWTRARACSFVGFSVIFANFQQVSRKITGSGVFKNIF